MPSALVLINVELGHESQMLKEVKALPRIAEAYSVYGVYDMVVKVTGDTMDEIKDTTRRIRQLPSVRSTLTMIVTEE